VAEFTVVLTDNIFPDLDLERNMLKSVGASFIEVPKGEPLDAYVADADAVINTYAEVSAEVIEKMTRCKLVIRNGIGVDTIDVDACTRKGIMVANVPHYCSDEAATHTMALMLATVRKLKSLNQSVINGHWEAKRAAPIFSLPGKKLGLVGFGKIPRLVAEKARAFGLQIMASDPYVSREDMSASLVEKVDFDELISQSDIVSIHCPLTEQTRNLFNIRVFQQMKPGAYLINTARGPIVNEEDLICALERGMIAGAGLDVLEKNAVDLNNPLLEMEQVIITPHAAWYSEESIVRRRVQTIESVIAVLQGGEPGSLCNKEVRNRRN